MGVWVVISLISKYGCLHASSEEGENIKITCKKAWKIISHNKLSNFFQFLNVNIYKN
jgi:hypothetical protein